MILISDGTCQNDFCANESYIINVGLASSQGATLSMNYQQLPSVLKTDYMYALHTLFMSKASPTLVTQLRSHKNHFGTCHL